MATEDREGLAIQDRERSATRQPIEDRERSATRQPIQDRDQSGAGADREPALVVVCGLPGVGKSTVASWIADRLDAAYFRTDEIRKELFPEPAYTRAETETVYETLVERGRAALARGENAVLDGTFKRRRHRLEPVEVARELAVTFRLVKVEAAESVVRDRIRDRTEDVSDADVSVHEQFREEFEPIDIDHEVLDNSAQFAVTERELERRFPQDAVLVPQ